MTFYRETEPDWEADGMVPCAQCRTPTDQQTKNGVPLPAEEQLCDDCWRAHMRDVANYTEARRA